MEIRKYKEKDKENLRHICIATAVPTKNEKEKELLTLMYNDYFTEQESENIFVATNENDDAIGYILGCVDFKKFKNDMKKIYLPKIWKLSKVKWILMNLEFLFQNKLSKKYPAFLHIDILDGYQRMGLGHKLMDALLSHLKEIGSTGVMLGVGSGNEKGISFYKKYGFHEIRKIPFCVQMGIFLK